ncbi:MAG: hypothetical protein OXJ52_00445 [Oligoflexia bacterium]|nr:hypothetical protein [Oligoflexia bacterium]
MLFRSFKQSFKFAPAVLKDTTLYFGMYFLVLGSIVLAVFQNSSLLQGLSSSPATIQNILSQGMLFLSSIFTVFIVPYYAFKYSQGAVPKFWDFIRDNIWRVVLAHIKAFFVILLFLLLLIVPGLYKAIRFSFLTETVLFDKQTQRSALKQADSNTRGHFWRIILFFILQGIISALLALPLKIISFSSSNLFLTGLGFIFFFYLKCFILLWKIQFFFEIKKQKGEEISC